MTDDLWRLDATELARLIRLGRASSREATQSCLSRLHAVNPMINAVVRLIGSGCGSHRLLCQETHHRVDHRVYGVQA